MEKVDLYKALEVSKEASQDEIRRSYRRLARKFHPDANPGDKKAEERFKEIQHAYEVLSNPEKRREYDEGPRTFFGSQGTGQRHPSGADFADISDLLGGFGNLGDIFGRTATATQRTAEKGENITVNIRLNFKDALNGVTTRVGVPVEEACGQCRGTGAAPGTAPRTCPECGGRGVQSRDQGFFALSTPCSRCGGEGWHEDQDPGQGKRGQEGWACGRPLCRDAGRGTSGLQATWRRLRGRGACELRRSGARGADRGAKAQRGHGEGQVACWHAGRQAVEGAWRGSAESEDRWWGER